MRGLALLPLPTLLLAAGCSGDPVIARTDLSQSLQSRALDIQGVTIEPQTGRRFVLDTQHGIFVQRDGAFELYADPSQLRAEGHEPLSAFTDLAAVGDDQFALIAINDGFLFDRVTGLFQRHFCYEPAEIPPEPEPDPNPVEPQPQPIQPGPEPEPVPTPVKPRPDPIDPGEEYFQLSKNLAFDAKNARLVAQPQTFADDDGALLSAHIGTFALNDGTEQVWFELPTSSIEAGGLAIDAEGRALLGWGTSLWRYSFAEERFERVGELEGLVAHIDGLAFDPITETALIVDDTKKELVEIDLDAALQ
jgi:hypothetical protein